jgi:two-component system, OmpR family, phosphate regulon sensor histidine kinase PhoR
LSLPSAEHAAGDDGELLRRFVEASRRAEIVALVNSASTEAELGEVVASELCEAFEAEIAFVLVERPGTPPRLVGSYGITDGDADGVVADPVLRKGLGHDDPHVHGTSGLLGVGARSVAVSPFAAGDGSRVLVGAARFYDAGFGEAEVALLEAVTKSTGHALEQVWVAAERDILLERERKARAAAEAATERIQRLQAITEERAKAARALEYIAEGVLMVDAEDCVVFWNPAAEAITGVTAPAVLGRPASEAIPGWGRVAPLVPVGGSGDKIRTRAETVPLDVGDREVWLSVSGVQFAGGTVYAFRDVTNERQLEQLKADFIATVSHELRTPLAAVHGAAMTLRNRHVALTEGPRNRLLSVIEEQSGRLASIIDEILLASQLDAGRLRVSSKPVDPLALVRTVLDAAQSHAPPGISIRLRAPSSVPPVRADAGKLRQVLANLVGNAVKYSPDGGLVEVKLEPRERHLCLLVCDRGLGIPEHEQERIFEKFYRLDPDMNRGVGGTGLGLYICRELVQRMDGRISVKSRAGKGSTFLVELPLAEQS